MHAQVDPSRTLPRIRVPLPAEPRRDHLPLGEPEGTPDRVEVTSRSIERGGRPWIPVTGEIHYSRIPRERWSEVLGHARAGGLDSVATYVLWQAHEPQPGEFSWTGNLDLRAFVELAGSHGLQVVVRMGPWAHGEARHGGFPDWLLDRGTATRTNDPAYLELVERFYAQIVAQIADLTHAEGGPVVGAQMDNELYDQPQHLARLRTIAEDLGLRVPLWTATGWGGAQVPDSLLPLYGAYADGFWEEATTGWPAFAAFHFRYSPVRDDLSVGADLREALDGIAVDPGAVVLKDDDALPFATCELGGGMHVAYHRRPLVEPQDVAALSLAKIGSGSIWQGYYMYAGGTQRTGPGGTQQESHVTGYPNDVPSRTYDFHAPIGEHGQIRPHHHLLRRQHLWLATEGAALAAMTTTVGGGSEDPEELRWSVRSDGHRGYVFLSTYQPSHHPIAAQTAVQVEVELDDGAVVRMPSHPVDLPAGVSVVWPLRYPLTDDVVLRSATAQLVTRIALVDADLVVLAATDGLPVELVLEGHVPVGGAGAARAIDGATVVDLTQAPGPSTVVELPGVRILVLDEVTANQLYRLELGGRERLVLCDVPATALEGSLVLRTSQDVASVAVLPAPAGLRGASGAPVADGPWSRWTVEIPSAGTHRIAGGLRPVAADVPDPVRGGPMHRLSAPTDFDGAARVHLDVPAHLLEGADRALLRVTWTGDVGRAVIGDEVVSDHFWHGRVWDVDLTPHRSDVSADGLTLQLFPWRHEAGVWVDPSVRGVEDGIVVQAVDVLRVQRVELELLDT